MKIKISFILIINLLFLGAWFNPAHALEYTQKDKLFSMNIPEGLHWAEGGQEMVVTYPDRKTVAIDIQWVPSRDLSQAEIKNIIKQDNDKMIKEGIQAHNGTLIDDREIKLSGVYATQLDFKTSPPNPMQVAYISFFNKGYAFTVTYGSPDDKMRSMLDDIIATIKFR
jgi:hypothetical protein